MSPEDALAVREVVELHGHLADAGAFERFGELCTADVRYDTTALGGPVIRGLGALVEASEALGERNPVAHHVTNVVVRDSVPDQARAWSKALGVAADGSVGSLVYLDRLVRTADGWRIAERRILPRTTPLKPYPLP